MKRILLTLTAILISVSVQADSGIRSLPLAIPKAYWNNAEKREIILDALCNFIGLPNNAESKAVVQTKFQPTLVTNVIGSVAQGVPSGSDWYISANSKLNWLGNDKSGAEVKLNELQANTNVTQYMLIGGWCPSPDAWIGTEWWGIVSQEVE